MSTLMQIHGKYFLRSDPHCWKISIYHGMKEADRVREKVKVKVMVPHYEDILFYHDPKAALEGFMAKALREAKASTLPEVLENAKVLREAVDQLLSYAIEINETIKLDKTGE